ncbi:hypothetical protein KDA_67650 [Dictyobacter alpinus]|uniref:Uncharacterized protein n=1 Tax=Dictyobacter alpinus TaxID=2014873 RepID=A0A402BIP9_9CHLR|nr:hypothetical protein [Dictyobacter alpinus]GCE31281.1 hypothetical protein KDA_67650 [Dictyobacter alpinus]
MTWKTINEILGLASIDPEFCEHLLANPIAAIDSKGYLLTIEERRVLYNIQAKDIYDFSTQLLRKTGYIQ